MSGFSATAIMAGARSTSRRGKRPHTDPLQVEVKDLADALWEDIVALADALAPDEPYDHAPLDDFTQWRILETAAVTLSPAEWDDPEALEDLYRLKEKFMGVQDPSLKAYARAQKRIAAITPSLYETPQNPEFQKKMRALRVADQVRKVGVG